MRRVTQQVGRGVPFMRIVTAITLLTSASLANAANQTSARLYAMSEAEQFAVWRLVLTQSGFNCSAVKKTMYQGGSSLGDMWSVACSDGNEYAVKVASDSSTKIIACDELKRIDAAINVLNGKPPSSKSGCWVAY